MQKPPAIETQNKGFYTDMDTLYDTRLATLDLLDSSIAKMALKNDYLNRDEDKFPYVDRDIFKSLYETRDLEVLERAMPTKAIEIIREFIRIALKQNIDTPNMGVVEVYVNVYPYKVEKSVATEMCKALFHAFGSQVSIHMLNLRPELVTPKFFSETIAVAMMYDYDQWLEIHAKNDNLRKNQIPSVTLHGPRIYKQPKPNDNDLRDFKRTGPEPFKAMEIGLSALVGMDFIEAEYFSAVLPMGFVQSL